MMKRVKATFTLVILLTASWCIYTGIRDICINNVYSLDSYLSAQIIPSLQLEVVKYTRNDKEPGYLVWYEKFQEKIQCWLESSRGENEGRAPADMSRRPKSSSYKRIDMARVCPSLASNSDNPVLRRSLSVDALCPLLRRKKVLFVGPETTFHLHANLLQALELYENRSHSCLGTEFCTFHQICRIPRSINTSEPFFPPGGFKKYPSNRELNESQSGIIKYILSNSLYAGSDTQDPRYNDPLAQVDRETGVRQKERYWLGQARKADVLILNRGPLPAPVWTYDGTRQGNWSFAQKPIRVRHSRSFERDDEKNMIKSNTLYGEGILDIALRVTVERFLPEILETLQTLSKEARPPEQVVIWHGSWVMESRCAGQDTESMSVLPVSPILDPWTLFYNAQVHMQNHVLRVLLPQYKVLFVPMIIPSWRSNEAGYSEKSIMGRKDCLRYQFGSILEEVTRGALLRGMSLALEENPLIPIS